MVARTPPKQRKVLAPLDPVLLRETVKKVDKCMARLQELQYTVTGGNKVISGVSLSPRSTRGYLRTSLRCKQESLRIKNGTPRKSPKENFPATAGGEWRGMSLTAMLVGATVGEILQATQFAREIVEAVATKMKKSSGEDPKTPVTRKRNQTPNPEKTELRVRRKKEKQYKLQSIKSESDCPKLQRARSRINFKVSPPKVRELDKENNRYLANRVLPRNKPWAKKTVLFPNPLFHSMPSQQQKFCKTRSPVIARNKDPLFLSTPTSQQQKPSKTRSPVIARNKQTTPHKFLIKSPPSASKFQVKIRSPPVVSSFSPTRSTNLTHPLFHSTPTSQQQKPSKTRYKQTTTHKFLIKSPPSASKFQVKIRSPPVVASLSPTRPTTHLCKKPAKLSTTSKLRRSFSPSKLANRLMSPLKSRKLKNVQKCDGQMSGLKQRPTFVPTQFSTGRI